VPKVIFGGREPEFELDRSELILFLLPGDPPATVSSLSIYISLPRPYPFSIKETPVPGKVIDLLPILEVDLDADGGCWVLVEVDVQNCRRGEAGAECC
jgi:hypothetical protein